MRKNVEILAPAGSYESLKAAIAAGADAVYIGGTRFGARAYADNLDTDAMLTAIDYVHLHGKKIYLTINTLLKEKELKNELYEYLLPYYKQGIDAVIVQDIGVLQFVKEHFPDLPIHASTQMTITDLEGAKFMEKQGVERVVTSREMHMDEIREISENTKLEIESFVHGALCYCYSGQCLYSSMIGGRSGNRGQCAQPCRLPYRAEGERKNQYILSLKDICTLEYIPELVESGIFSFKIEGRMKKPEYVALVTAMYRKYVDLYLANGKAKFSVNPKDKEKLMDLYNRGGFHGGYYYQNNGRDMLALDRPNHAGVPALQVIKYSGKTVTAKAIVDIHAKDVIELPEENENFTFASDVKKGRTCTFSTHKKQTLSNGTILNRIRNESLLCEIQDTIIKRKVQETVSGKLTLSADRPSELRVFYQDITVEVQGSAAQKALNQPMDRERIEKQMRKTGNTPFVFADLEIELDGDLFIPMQNLNELRREALEILERRILSNYRRNSEQSVTWQQPVCDTVQYTNMFYVYVEEMQQFESVLKRTSVKRIYADANMIERIWENAGTTEIILRAHQAGKEIYLAMPHIFRSKTKQKFSAYYDRFLTDGWDGVLIRNYESYEFLTAHGYSGKIVTDYSLYQLNRYAKRFWLQQGAESITASLELNYNELKEVGLENSELIVYGYYPMMISAQCVVKTLRGCKMQSERIILKDRYQKAFVVKNRCDYCYNVIYNTAPVVLTDQTEEIETLAPKALRLHFTIENEKEIDEILDLYETAFFHKSLKAEPSGEFTRGHFKRGIK